MAHHNPTLRSWIFFILKYIAKITTKRNKIVIICKSRISVSKVTGRRFYWKKDIFTHKNKNYILNINIYYIRGELWNQIRKKF